MSGIYIHIPFCKQACHYCDFHFSTSLKLKNQMITSIIKEIQLRSNEFPNEVNSLYIGGGTPSLMENTDLELIFTALNHDLGKYGTDEHPYYVPNPSDWHRKNQGSMFKPNPELDFMLIQDRSLFLLQKHGVSMSQKEYLAIRLHDGIYDDANKAYFISYSPDAKFKTNIVYILHQADFMASKIEYDRWNKK